MESLPGGGIVGSMIGHTSVVGSLLREWRGVRRMSQLDLAMAAEVLPRHLSFVESGRAVPSREMVLTLAKALEVPVRDRNAMRHHHPRNRSGHHAARAPRRVVPPGRRGDRGAS